MLEHTYIVYGIDDIVIYSNGILLPNSERIYEYGKSRFGQHNWCYTQPKNGFLSI